MKVCLLNDSFPPVIDGVANTVLNYANVLTNNDLAEVEVGTPKYPKFNYSTYPFKVVPYQSFNIANIMEGYRAGNPVALPSVSKLAAFQPDIIHSHCPAISSLLARILRVRTDAPIIFTYHTKFDYDIARATKSQLLQKEAINFMVSNISAADEVWVVSKGAGENLKSVGFEGEYRVMTNGVDFAKGRMPEDYVKETVSGYDLPEGVPLFLFVGRLMMYKGLPVIVDALKILNAKGLDFRMVFIGGGNDADILKNQIREFGLEKKVFFTGPIYDRDRLRAWNSRGDLFLFPSVYDTNGIVVREAAACGLASVLIRDSCAAEDITDGRNGYLIEENGASMAALLENVMQDIPGLKAVGQHAMDEVYVSWEDSIRRAHARYGEILEMKKEGYFEAGKAKRMSPEAFAGSLVKLYDSSKKLRRASKSIYTGIMNGKSRIYEGLMSNMSEAMDNAIYALSMSNQNSTSLGVNGLSDRLAAAHIDVDEQKTDK